MDYIPFNVFSSNAISSLKASALSKLFLEYGKNFEFEPISEIGFNAHSGLAYIALESVDYDLVCYLFNSEVKYLYNDLESGEEILFETTEEYKEFKEMNLRYENEKKQILDF